MVFVLQQMVQIPAFKGCHPVARLDLAKGAHHFLFGRRKLEPMPLPDIKVLKVPQIELCFLQAGDHLFEELLTFGDGQHFMF